MRGAKSQIYTLDLLRFGAALLVVFHHLMFWAARAPVASDGGPPLALPDLADISWFGWIGVEIFFVISGFVIAYSSNGASPAGFLKSRFLRLWPAILVVAPATFWIPAVLGYAAVPHQLGALGRTLAVWPTGPWLDTVYWTLAIELVFYGVVFGLLCLDQFCRIELIMGAIGLASCAFWAFHLARGLPHLAADPSTLRTRLMLLSHGCFFALGVYLWLIFYRGATWRRLVRAAAFSLGCLAEIAIRAKGQAGIAAPPVLVPVVAWTAAMALLIIGVARRERISGLLAPHAQLVKSMGLMTYPLYLLHDMAGVAAERMMLRAGLSPFVAVFLTIAAAIALAWVLATHVEPRLRDLLKRRALAVRPALASWAVLWRVSKPA